MIGSTTDYSITEQLHHVPNPVTIQGDETIANRVLKDLVNNLQEESYALYSQAKRIQDLTRSSYKFKELRKFVDNCALVQVVPNEVNRQGNITLITKKYTIGLEKDTKIAMLDETTLATLRALNRAEINLTFVAEQASGCIDRTIKLIQSEELAASRSRQIQPSYQYNTYQSQYQPRKKERSCFSSIFGCSDSRETIKYDEA